ncbi:hypothetical protein NX801_24840 [Streptomyces sp. LP05-1]|uniref:Uncharacterized protein n=1 Tax=Streptomyces pyxinae TaxID=2970734 RepID=A0ABT2CNK0_9ACTN|nr:hypothetical protein [Streptomyces sp. LP05-1]MCS0638826.1 hypothetical protein [Streptomyces sp. LP05-1]
MPSHDPAPAVPHARPVPDPDTAPAPAPAPASHDTRSAPGTGSLPAAGSAGGHRVTTTERGSFCLARCACGWTGPARRSRDRARADAEAHPAGPEPSRPAGSGAPGRG